MFNVSGDGGARMATSDWTRDPWFVRIECDWSSLTSLRLQNREVTLSHVHPLAVHIAILQYLKIQKRNFFPITVSVTMTPHGRQFVIIS